MAISTKVGIIGGTGLDDASFFKLDKEEAVETPFGTPSDALQHGTVDGVPCILLPRHGRRHSVSPTNVNYRANLWALREAGCTHVLAATACGSLREEIQPGHFVVLDSFIDWTRKRALTFNDGSAAGLPGIPHLPMVHPFCSQAREILIDACKTNNLPHHKQGTMVTIEGPRFSTKAESCMFRTLGCDVINMTTVPEVVLARELGLSYASLAMATDYDCWRENSESVSVEAVMAVMRKNASNAIAVLKTAVSAIGQKDWSKDLPALKKEVAMNTMIPKA